MVDVEFEIGQLPPTFPTEAFGPLGQALSRVQGLCAAKHDEGVDGLHSLT
jgi:hypothetical protein